MTTDGALSFIRIERVDAALTTAGLVRPTRELIVVGFVACVDVGEVEKQSRPSRSFAVSTLLFLRTIPMPSLNGDEYPCASREGMESREILNSGMNSASMFIYLFIYQCLQPEGYDMEQVTEPNKGKQKDKTLKQFVPARTKENHLMSSPPVPSR